MLKLEATAGYTDGPVVAGPDGHCCFLSGSSICVSDGQAATVSWQPTGNLLVSVDYATDNDTYVCAERGFNKKIHVIEGFDGPILASIGLTVRKKESYRIVDVALSNDGSRIAVLYTTVTTMIIAFIDAAAEMTVLGQHKFDASDKWTSISFHPQNCDRVMCTGIGCLGVLHLDSLSNKFSIYHTSCVLPQGTNPTDPVAHTWKVADNGITGVIVTGNIVATLDSSDAYKRIVCPFENEEDHETITAVAVSCWGETESMFVVTPDSIFELDWSDLTVRQKIDNPTSGPLSTCATNASHQLCVAGKASASAWTVSTNEPSKTSLVSQGHSAPVLKIQHIIGSNVVLTVDQNGNVGSYEPDTLTCTSLCGIPDTLVGSISTVAMTPLAALVVLGTSDGGLRALDCSNGRVRTIFHKNIFASPISGIAIDPLGTHIALYTRDVPSVVLVDRTSFVVTGFVPFPGAVESISLVASTLLVAVSDTTGRVPKTLVYTMHIPEQQQQQQQQAPSKTKERFESMSYANMRATGAALDNAVRSVELMEGGKEHFMAMTFDGKCAVYTLPTASIESPSAKPTSTLKSKAKPESVHSLSGAALHPSHSHTWLASTGREGRVVVHILEAAKRTRGKLSHVTSGNVHSLPAASEAACMSYAMQLHSQTLRTANAADACVTGTVADISVLFTSGRDGTVKRWTLNECTLEPTASSKGFRRQGDAMATWLRDLAGVNAACLDGLVQEAPLCERPKEAVEVTGVVSDRTHNAERDGLVEELDALKQELADLLRDNDNMETDARLPQSEFIIDAMEQERILARGRQEETEVRREIELDMIRDEYVCDMIREECWDGVKVQGKFVDGFDDSSKVRVENFPMSASTTANDVRLARLKTLRRIELIEAATRDAFAGGGGGGGGEGSDEHASVGDEEEEEAAADDAGGDAQGGGDARTSAAAISDVAKTATLLYAPADLTTRNRKISQIHLLNAVCGELKVFFNNEFETVCKAKENEIGKINEKQQRVRAILNELEDTEQVAEWQDIVIVDQAKSLFEVKESDISVERFVSPEEQKRIDAEHERKRALASDVDREESIQRALEEMMGGQLEAIVDDDLAKRPVMPEWMVDRDPDQMTDEEGKQYKEFKEKSAAFLEDLAKHHKGLAAELRKIQVAISEIKAAFDQRLLQHFQLKIDITKKIHCLELQVLQIQQAIIEENAIMSRFAGIDHALATFKQLKLRSTQNITRLRRELDVLREKHDKAVADDRLMERHFKRDFSDYEVESYYDQLARHSKRRPKPGQSRDEFDADQVPPSDVPALVWERLVEHRHAKMDMEAEVRHRQLVITELLGTIGKRERENERLLSEIEALIVLRKDASRELENVQRNIKTLIVIKQGQCEVASATFGPNTEGAVLIRRSDIVELNENICLLGTAKVDFLTDIKDFRRDIDQLKWENERLDMENEDLVFKLKTIEKLRVTKELQEIISQTDDSRQATEISLLEKRIKYNKKSHEHKKSEKKKVIARLRRLKREKQKENDGLKEQVRDLAFSVAQRNQIHAVQIHEQTEGPEERLRNLSRRRNLVELAKRQAEEMVLIKEEVERLRLRTFPSFPHQGLDTL